MLFVEQIAIITNKGQKSNIVNGVADYIHLFVGLKPSMAVSDMVRDIKNNLGNRINDKKFVRGNIRLNEMMNNITPSGLNIMNEYCYL
ncbi:MAG: hypothetical protein CVU06_10685 [Bacteroidetes bacterium HGW-Bacteroidetes-22]|nr:MAG: hypothetical protein CVU06_10685 [Bacteroidetes bacterium HGW-Bacteroidetes-22]